MDIVERLYAESQDTPNDSRWEAAEVIERLRDELESSKIDFAETHQSNMAVARALEGTGYTGTYAECIEGLKREIVGLKGIISLSEYSRLMEELLETRKNLSRAYNLINSTVAFNSSYKSDCELYDKAFSEGVEYEKQRSALGKLND